MAEKECGIKEFMSLIPPGISLNIQKCLGIHWQTFLYNMPKLIFFYLCKNKPLCSKTRQESTNHNTSTQKDIIKSQRAKNTVRRLLMSIFFLECIGMTSMYSQVHEAITPYVDFLSHKQLSREYLKIQKVN